MSGGRLILGLGAGWLATEFAQLGIPLPPPAERHRALKATIAEVERRWRGQPMEVDVSPSGLTIRGDRFGWPPVQEPRPPLLIGGAGEKLTLRGVAQFADMCNLDVPTAEVVGHKLAILRGHCESIGRPYESIVRSHFQNFVVLAPTEERARQKCDALPNLSRFAVARTPRQLVEYYRPLIAAGIQYVVVQLAAHDDVETVELLSTRVMPELQGFAEATDEGQTGRGTSAEVP